jgi:3-oxoacyl-[acyl-carrier-protein] synthase III
MTHCYLQALAHRLGASGSAGGQGERGGVGGAATLGPDVHCPVTRTAPEDMIRDCVAETLDRAGLRPGDIDTVVHATGADLRTLEGDASLISALDACGLGHAMLAGAALSGCANSNLALTVADGMLARGARHVLILHPEFADSGPRLQAPTIALAGDGVASAVMTARRQGAPCFAFLDGFAKSSARLCALELNEDTLGEYASVALAGMRQTADAIYKRHGVGAPDMALLIAPNYAGPLVQMVALAAGFGQTRIYGGTHRQAGHVLAADSLINLQTAAQSGAIAPGDKVLVFAVGTYSWSVAYLQMV